jgi:hypothetical protein
MAVSLTHTTVATGTDAGNAQIGKTQWNETHTLEMATARLLGRTTAGTGAVEEITAGTGLTLSAGALAVSKAFPTGDIVGTTDTQTLSNKTFSDNPTFSGGTANGVLYLNASKALTSGSTLVYDGSNLGLGVTPTTWDATARAFQLGSYVALANYTDYLDLSTNVYYNGTYKYLNTGSAASKYSQFSGSHSWSTAASGTANNTITFTESMRLNASGNLGVGTPSPTQKLDVVGAVRAQAAATQDSVILQGRAGGTSSYGVTLTPTTLTANRTITLPDATTTLVGTDVSQQLSNKTLVDPAIQGAIIEDVFTITDGASVDIDPANGTIQLWTLGANRTPTATNFVAGESVTLMILDGTAYTVTWTTIGVVWVGSTAPALDTTKYTVIELWKVSSTVYGAFVGYA